MGAPYSRKENKGKKRLDIPTPIWVCEQLAELWLKHHNAPKAILDPSEGDGRLTRFFPPHEKVAYEIKNGTDFLSAPAHQVDLAICNPPFNLGIGRKLGSEQFLEKIIEVAGADTPIILFVPMGFRLNQRKHSKRIVRLRDEFPPITTIITLPLDVFDGVEFHNEILIFNAPELPPHLTWLPGER